MTLGEQRVRISFNPSSNSEVEDIKRRAADAIDWCAGKLQELHNSPGQDASERARLINLAMTHFENAAMWAVKAVTG